jgi:hypothetical protein
MFLCVRTHFFIFFFRETVCAGVLCREKSHFFWIRVYNYTIILIVSVKVQLGSATPMLATRGLSTSKKTNNSENLIYSYYLYIILFLFIYLI